MKKNKNKRNNNLGLDTSLGKLNCIPILWLLNLELQLIRKNNLRISSLWMMAVFRLMKKPQTWVSIKSSQTKWKICRNLRKRKKMEKLICQLLIKEDLNLFKLLKLFMVLSKSINSKVLDGWTIFLSKVSTVSLLMKWDLEKQFRPSLS